MTDTVAGRYLGFSERHGTFAYAYTCPRCGKAYKSSSPELTAPAMCHACFTGRRNERFKAAKKARDRKHAKAK